MADWQLEDRTTLRGGGCLTLRRDGIRICDFFPFAAGADEKFIRQQAGMITALLNEQESTPGDGAPERRG